MPALRLIADADAMFRRMAAEMNAIEAQMDALAAMPFTLPPPQQVISTAGIPAWVNIPPGNEVVVTSVSNGRETCSQTITYSYPANGGRPIVHVSQSGNACGALHLNGPVQVETVQPASPPNAVPHAAPVTHPPRLWNVVYHAPMAAQN
jgi:hypothetical protein